MDDKLVAIFLGAAFGSAGYWLNTFWMKPLLQYREIRSKILIDLIFFAQVTNAEGLNETMQKRYEERVVSNRRLSAELSACLLEIPHWYRWWMKQKGLDPQRAASDLIGFSNTTDFEAGSVRRRRIKQALGFIDDE
jgi:hypothetical protein